MRPEATAVERALGTDRMSGERQLPSLARRNPSVWRVTIDGLVIDVRAIPLDVRSIVFTEGMVPLIPDGES